MKYWFLYLPSFPQVATNLTCTGLQIVPGGPLNFVRGLC